MKYLAIDYGSKRIGLATNDDTATIAFPYTTLINTAKSTQEILDIIAKEKIDKVILGESKNNAMKDNPIMTLVHEFKKELEGRGVAVEFHAELYSSAQVLSIMGEQNKAIDASAAAIILQSYLDLQKHI